MLKTLRFVFLPILLGLAFAFVFLLFTNPQLVGFAPSNSTQHLNQTHLSFANAVRSASPAVVNIYSESISKQPRSLRTQSAIKELGSGIIMSKKGYILTNYHVINNADQIIVILKDGRKFTDVQLIGYDTPTDLALLKINADHLPEIPVDNNFVPQVGDVVLAIGNPLNLGQTITQGIISATDKTNIAQTRHTRFIQMDAAINTGNSGGAVINTNGTLVGITSAKFKHKRNLEVQGIFFAIPYSLAKDVMDKIIKYGRVVRGYLGFTADAVDRSGRFLKDYNTPMFGMRITHLDPLGPTWQAGLQKNDIIIKIDGQGILNMQATLEKIANTLPGTQMTLTLYRGNQLMNVKVTVAEASIQ